MVAVVSILVNY